MNDLLELIRADRFRAHSFLFAGRHEDEPALRHPELVRSGVFARHDRTQCHRSACDVPPGVFEPPGGIGGRPFSKISQPPLKGEDAYGLLRNAMMNDYLPEQLRMMAAHRCRSYPPQNTRTAFCSVFTSE